MSAQNENSTFLGLLSKVKTDFLHNVPQLLLFDICFKIVAAAILTPLSAWVFRKMVSASGSIVVSNEQLLSFSRSPLGITVIVLTGAFVLSTLFAEQAGMIVICSRTMSGQKINYRQALWYTIKYLPNLFLLGVRQVIGYAAFLMPFAAVGGLVYIALTRNHDINSFLTAKPPTFWFGAFLAVILAAGSLLVVGVLYVNWLFSVPGCVIANERPAVALRSSRFLAKGNLFRVGLVIFGWSLAVTAVGAVITLVFKIASTWILNIVGENLSIIIATVGAIEVIYTLVMFCITFIGFSVTCLLIKHLYRDLHVKKNLHLPPNLVAETSLRERPVFSKRTLWAVAIFGLVATVAVSGLILEELDIEHPVAVTAHRGSSRYAPENTLSAIKRAIEDRADFAEIDVQDTADGVIVVLHDTDLKKVAGLSKKIWEVTYDEIRTLDAGSWFASDFKGEHIPTLQEVIELAGDKIKLNIELKFNDHNKNLVQNVIKIIHDYDFADRCVISSLNYDALLETRRIDPELKIGHIIFRSIGNSARTEADFLSLRSKMVSTKLISSARKHKKDVHVWTINNPKEMSYFMDLGVDNILTDVPDVLVGLIEERASLSDIEKVLLRTGGWLRR